VKKEEFLKLGKKGYNAVPVVLQAFADLDTPLSVYLKFANQANSYLLESVQGGERFGRFSFIGLPTKNWFEVTGKQCKEIREGRVIEDLHFEDPLAWVAEIQARTNAYYPEDMPRFLGGLVGYFGYETVHYVESRVGTHKKTDELGTPDILLLESKEVVVYDNLAGKLFFVVFADPNEDGSWEFAQKRLEELLTQLRRPVEVPDESSLNLGEVVEETDQSTFESWVAKAKDYIVNGDIMQVVLAQRMKAHLKSSPLSLYRSLRALNPSPYMFQFNFGNFHVVGASPEILVRLEGETVTLRPIAGTRPRGKNRQEDNALEEELLADPKERAEHVMLMDLGRNDVGRVAATGTVKVTDQMVIERYSHVMHIVSNVEGKLKDGEDAISVLRASFPAGTVSGAPKVRAMEIIDELEPSKRGIYAGAVGYLGFNGDMDVAIAIRTAVVKDGVLYVQAGAGVVADSVPENEWVETKNKAKAVLRAAEIAESGLNSRIE
jgi:anthranilate synthase component 1